MVVFTASRLATLGAAALEQAFDDYLAGFREITRRAGHRFAKREWQAAVTDGLERLDLYERSVQDVTQAVRRLVGDRVEDRVVWAGMKAVYSSRIAGRSDWELAETFFNSVTRRVFSTVGVDPDVEFVGSDFLVPPTAARRTVHRTYQGGRDPAQLVEEVLKNAGFRAPFWNLKADSRRAGDRLSVVCPAGIDRAEVIRDVFYRRKGAYVVGRLLTGGRCLPMVFALLNTPQGITVDAVLTAEDDVSILFSFTRSHFHIVVEPAHALVEFLGGLMPRKRVAELYISIGYHKHGKTELYRDLIHHLADSEERFDLAPGIPGLVMVVFTTPGYDLVVKVIRDRFPPQKRITRREVMNRYRLVFRHDRAGRLVEAQEFEHLRLDRRRFSNRLLDELLAEAGRTIRLDGDHVVIDHAYLERRVTPLDLHLGQADAATSRQAVIDYGQAIRDLAATGVFPGDLLLRNFGVTRHGRVVFYDYDELVLLTSVQFREIPVPRTPEEELSPGGWFGVGAGDVFPAELGSFLGMSGELREVFEEHHGELLQQAFWETIQERLAAGEIVDIVPYKEQCRLTANSSSNPSSGSPSPGRRPAGAEPVDLSIGSNSPA